MTERLVASLEGPPGAPVVVLGNSLGTTREIWEPQVAVLSGRFRAW
jgi:3-oxoadipate enol-lactonase